jgi:hypothetical protein
MPWPTNQSIEHPVGANVYGSAVLRTEPDLAVAEIGVARVASTAKAAFSETGKAAEAVVRSVRRNNISPEAVEVSRVVLTSAYEGFGQAQKFIGYRARVTFRILINRLDSVEGVLTGGLGSGDKQAQAKLGRVEIDKVAVAFGPPAGCEVMTEAVHCPLLGVRPDSRPDRYSAADMLVQVCLGPAPVGLVEAVRAVPRNEHRFRAGSDRAGQFGQRGPADKQVSELGKIVTIQPEQIGSLKSFVNTTTRRTTRRISRRPAIGSCQ